MRFLETLSLSVETLSQGLSLTRSRWKRCLTQRERCVVCVLCVLCDVCCVCCFVFKNDSMSRSPRTSLPVFGFPSLNLRRPCLPVTSNTCQSESLVCPPHKSTVPGYRWIVQKEGVAPGIDHDIFPLLQLPYGFLLFIRGPICIRITS